MRDHPLRQRLLDEVHARSFSDFRGAGRFIRFVYLADRGDDAALIRYVNRYLKAADQPPMPKDSKYIHRDLSGFGLKVERHTEFVSISIIEDGLMVKTGLAAHAFDMTALSHLPFDFIDGVPAPLFHAIWLEVGGRPSPRFNEDKARGLLASRAAPSDLIDDGAGQLMISFAGDDRGFCRAAIFNHSMSAPRLGRMVQRVVEMETYRFLSMLGFAKAQETSGGLSDLAANLTSLTRDLSKTIKGEGKGEGSGQRSISKMVKSLSTLSARVEEIYADTLYRMAATKAYRQVFESRMADLKLSYLPGYQGIEGFIERRMTPAMQTCEAFSNRLDRLANRIERAGQLLQTQTEMKIQEQNRDLLQSMDRRAQAQLRLQQTVEGLSIAALTYYGVGLVGYMAKGLPLESWGAELDVIKAVAVPVVGAIVFAIIRRTRRHLRQQGES